MSATPDPFTARDTLDAAGRSHVVYRLDALGADLPRLPFTRQGPARERAAQRGPRVRDRGRRDALLALAPRLRRVASRCPFLPARVVLQDFTGVPAWSTWRRCATRWPRSGGDPAQINPLVPADLVIDHSVQVDASAPPTPSPATSTASSSATASATCSCAGARARSTTSASSRPAPASSTRSTSSTWPGRACCATSTARLAVPGHPGRHRLAHHDDQRPGRARLGRRRHRGRGRACSASRCTCSTAEVVGVKLHRRAADGRHRDRPGADASPRCSAPNGVVGKFVEFYGAGLSALSAAPTARPSSTWRPSTAPPRRSSRSTTRRCAILRRHRPRARGRRAGRGATAKDQGLFRTDGDPDPTFTEHARARPGHGRAEPGRPAPPAGPGGPRAAAAAFREAFADGLDGERARSAPARSTSTVDGDDRRCSTGSVVDRRDHLLHQHLEPVGDGRRRPAGQEGRRDAA